ncbi:hypothetical protein RFF05_05125 [Bengtsoniella intestinalis]|uniref:hypothetical protein n=1 Tax=Bengtsoniella intestinalis TaxID=3073143 RepID=UPI00391F2241
MGYYVSLRDNNFFVNAEHVAQVSEELESESYGPELDDAGNIISLEFDGEKLSGMDDMFKRIAPYVRSGSYVEMSGEDDSIWRWVFNNGECLEVYPTLLWAKQVHIVIQLCDDGTSRIHSNLPPDEVCIEVQATNRVALPQNTDYHILSYTEKKEAQLL